MKQRFCKVCGKLLTAGEHGELCWKHYTQLRKFGEFKDSNSRTCNDPNEFRIKKDYTEFDTYDKFGNVNYTYIIDTELYPEVSKHKWCTALYKGKPYAMEGKSKIKLYRFVLDPKPGTCVDHIDGNTLDNRKSNLRIASKSLNNINILKDGLKHKGVYQKKSGKWYASLQWRKKVYCSPVFETKEEALFARYILEQWYVNKPLIQNNVSDIAKLNQEQKDFIIKVLNNKFH